MGNEFEKWIESSAPAVEVNEPMKEVHLAVLKQRLRERDKQHKTRQKRTRRASVVAVALMFVLVNGNVSELGSDGFDLVISESLLVDDLDIVTVGFRESTFGVSSSMTTEEVQQYTEKAEWDQGIPVGVECTTIQGDADWSINFQYEVGGSTIQGSQSVQDRTSNSGMNHLNFYMSEEYEKMLGMVENGNLAAVSSRIETVDDFRFLIFVYNYNSLEFGPVVFQKGEPIH